jgi:hypothetical protein
LELAQIVLQRGLDYMSAKKQVAVDPKEVEFYEKQTAVYSEFSAILTGVVAGLGVGGATRKVRLSETQFQILHAGVASRNREEILAIHDLPEGAERTKRLDAFGEWEAFALALDKKDPRRFDTSQDADPDEDEDEESDEEDEGATA